MSSRRYRSYRIVLSLAAAVFTWIVAVRTADAGSQGRVGRSSIRILEAGEFVGDEAAEEVDLTREELERREQRWREALVGSVRLSPEEMALRKREWLEAMAQREREKLRAREEQFRSSIHVIFGISGNIGNLLLGTQIQGAGDVAGGGMNLGLYGYFRSVRGLFLGGDVRAAAFGNDDVSGAMITLAPFMGLEIEHFFGFIRPGLGYRLLEVDSDWYSEAENAGSTLGLGFGMRGRRRVNLQIFTEFFFPFGHSRGWKVSDRDEEIGYPVAILVSLELIWRF